MRVAAFATHPVQYHAPWFRALAERPGVELRVHYALLPDATEQGVGFDTPFEWDVPLLEGYDWVALENSARRPSLAGFFASRTPGVGRVLAVERPDAVLLTGWQALPLVQALRAAIRLGISRVVRGESNALRPRPRWVRVGHRRLLARYDAFLAIGRANREFYLRNGVDERRIFDAPYFVDNAWFHQRHGLHRPERAEIRREWGIAPEATCVLFAGKLVPKKRVLDLVRACEVAARGGRPLHLLVVGSGEQADAVRREARELDVPATFAGFLNQTEIGRAYTAADCLVLPSDAGETWGLVVNEAMVHGLPVVVSDRVGCGPDLVIEGETGWTYPCGDVRALAARIAGLAADPEEARRMGERARRHVESYSVERAVEGTVEALEFALQTSRSRH